MKISKIFKIIITCTICLTIFLSATAFSNTVKPLAATTRTVTDMIGRKVKIPVKVNHIIALSNNMSVATYIINPDKLLGWSFKTAGAANSDLGKSYIKSKYLKLPVIASDTSNSANLETIIKMKPDVIVCSNEDGIFDPDQLQNQLDIPIVYIDADLKNTYKVYQCLGKVLGDTKRANELAKDSAKTIGNVQQLVAKIPQKKRLKVYYAEGSDWLRTDVSGNVHTQVIDMAGGINVAKVTETKTGSMVGVSLEQIISWNPDVIIVGATAAKGDFYSSVYNSAAWASINAVKNKKIYKAPSLPFNWVDRPPSTIRALGVAWLANKLYPANVKLNMKVITKNYFSKYLQIKITDKEALNVMNSVS